MNRNLFIALLVSLGAHVFSMSAVEIVNPGDMGRLKPYTRVDFLGPILRKTSFDIMLDGMDPTYMPVSSYPGDILGESELRVVLAKRSPGVDFFSDMQERTMDISPEEILSAPKTVPDFHLSAFDDRRIYRGLLVPGKTAGNEHGPVYRPEPPRIMRGRYGDKPFYNIKMRVLIGPGGAVLGAEPVTTTGYPELDMTAVKYVQTWIFAPDNMTGESGEWKEIEVILNTGS